MPGRRKTHEVRHANQKKVRLNNDTKMRLDASAKGAGAQQVKIASQAVNAFLDMMDLHREPAVHLRFMVTSSGEVNVIIHDGAFYHYLKTMDGMSTLVKRGG